VLGHELTHRVQYNHDDGVGAPHQTKTFKEGTARAIEDLFDPQDTWVGALSYSSYASQAQTALGNTNTDWWAYGWRYNYAIAWKYYSEQLPGSTITEPGYGWNYFKTLYLATKNYVGIAAVNNAHATLGGPSHYEMWKKFARVLYTRDLNVSTVPSQEYYILDEQQAGDQPGPVTKNSGGTIDSGTSASWPSESVSKNGMDYYEVAVDASDCEVATVSFSNATGHPYFWVITRDGNDYLHDVGGSGTNWSQSTVIGDQTHLAAVVVGLDANATVDVEISCASPVMDIKQPLQLAPDYVQSLDVVVVQVLLTNGSPTAPVVSGLSYTDFEAEIGGTPALILGGGFVEEQYFLLVQAPTLSNGPKDLEILLNQPGTATLIASDSETEAVIYDASNTDNVLVIDRSGSMGWFSPPPLGAAQAAAHFFIDASNSSEGLAVVPYNHDIDPTQVVSMAFGTLPHRILANNSVSGLTASGATSIGDGLDNAVDQCTTSPTLNSRCLMILLSDGMENSYLMWSDVMTDVINAGQVMAVAFGPSADETLMQSIATATGGASYYNDVYVSAQQRAPGAPQFTVNDMYFDLGRTYLSVQARGEGRDEFLTEKGVIPDPMVVQTHTVMIDATTTEALFALDWNQRGVEMEFRLRKPDGTIISDTVATPYAFEDYFPSYHLGWRITNPDPGVWELLVSHQGGGKGGVPYQVLVSGHTSLSVELLLPDRLDADYTTGQQVPIRALIPVTLGGGVQLAAANEGVRMAAADSISMTADVTAPEDGTVTKVPLFDDGEHDDGTMGDGLYAGVYTLVTQAKEV
ncbi:MAG: VWA domain-containing protein, partial [Anaerolineae bacterium]